MSRQQRGVEVKIFVVFVAFILSSTEFVTDLD